MKQAFSASRGLGRIFSIRSRMWLPVEFACEEEAFSAQEDASAWDRQEETCARGAGAQRNCCPLFLNPVAAGFPSPADDYIERRLDLNEHLVRNPPATFFVRAQGDSMLGAGIHDGDILVVDRSIPPVHNKVVIAAVHGELTVKRLWMRDGMTVLRPENPAYPPLDMTGVEQFEVWGVVTSVIHSL